MRRLAFPLFAMMGCASDPAIAPRDAASEAATDVLTVTDLGAGVAELSPGEASPSGETSTAVRGAAAFDQPLTGLSGEARTAFIAGQALFQLDWTPHGVVASDRAGLGPVYNSTSCQACHLGNGRGAPPGGSGRTLISALLRVSIEGTNEHGGPRPHPVYGDQIQPNAIGNVTSEGAVRITYEDHPGRYGDGTPYSLIAPRITFEAALGDPGAGLLTSMRVAMSTVGLGFLEAISEADLLAREDPDDRDGDGISGRANRVWSVEDQRTRIGRFGWKANQPTLRQQNAAALVGDIGITSPLFPTDNCTAAQTTCATAAGQRPMEVNAERLALLTAFTRTVALPTRARASDPEVLRGKFLFRAAGCEGCHVPSWQTDTTATLPLLRNVTVWPYSDLLLHDMGEGLADGRPDFLATGREWRTPPLWGLSQQETVSGHLRLLHDGRARGVAEAVLWHGGEAFPSAERFRTMSAFDRAALVAFVSSL